MAKQPFSFGQGPAKGKRDETKRAVVGTDTNKLLEQINVVSRRLKVLEERYTNLDRKTQMTDQNMLASHKRINQEIKTTTMEMADISKEINHIKETVELIITELKASAKKEDVDVLEKYLKLWEPVKFMTREQVEKIVAEAIKGKQ